MGLEAPSTSLSAPPSLSAGPLPCGVVGTFSTNDFDELASLAPGWNSRYSQVGRGKFNGRLFMAHTSNLGVGKESSAPGIINCSSIPKQCVMFALPLRGGGRVVNRGADVPETHGMLLFDNEEVDFFTPAPLEAFVLIAERELFERRAEIILGRSLESLRQNDQVLIHGPARLREQLERHSARLEQSLLRDSSCLSNAGGASEFESALLDIVLLALDAPPTPTAVSHSRRQVASLAQRHLRDNLRNALGISAVCDAVGTSERTLHAAFREQFGITPKSYVKTLRLNAARQELRRATDGETVTQIAARWDFLHFGWFAHDYQLMFGELPSETLRLHRR